MRAWQSRTNPHHKSCNTKTENNMAIPADYKYQPSEYEVEQSNLPAHKRDGYQPSAIEREMIERNDILRDIASSLASISKHFTGR
jgi:hypothetical protein